MHSQDLNSLETIATAATSVLTIAEGLERTELDGSRITGHEISRLLLVIVDAVRRLSDEARAAMPELDIQAWLIAGQQLHLGGTPAKDARWFGIQALAPATLGWLQVYRSISAQPAASAASAELA